MSRDPRAFAEAWIAAWNVHDLEEILAHGGADGLVRDSAAYYE